jgi:hypothetical protein
MNYPNPHSLGFLFVHRKGSNGSGSEAATDRGAKSRRESSPTVIEDLLFSAREKSELFTYNILLVLSVYKEEFPWLYEAGNDFAKTVNSKCSKQAKTEAIGKLEKIIECTYELPVYKEMTPMKKECMMLLRELPRICYDMIERLS